MKLSGAVWGCLQGFCYSLRRHPRIFFWVTSFISGVSDNGERNGCTASAQPFSNTLFKLEGCSCGFHSSKIQLQFLFSDYHKSLWYRWMHSLMMLSTILTQNKAAICHRCCQTLCWTSWIKNWKQGGFASRDTLRICWYERKSWNNFYASQIAPACIRKMAFLKMCGRFRQSSGKIGPFIEK